MQTTSASIASYSEKLAVAFPHATPDDLVFLAATYPPADVVQASRLARITKLMPAATDAELASTLAMMPQVQSDMLSPSLAKLGRRLLTERAIVRQACTDLIAAKFWLRLDDGEAWATETTQDVGVIMAAIQSVDEESIAVLRQDTRTAEEGRAPSGFLRCGTVSLVYGNDGYDVICDYSMNLEKHLAGANALANKLESA